MSPSPIALTELRVGVRPHRRQLAGSGRPPSLAAAAGTGGFALLDHPHITAQHSTVAHVLRLPEPGWTLLVVVVVVVVAID